MLDAAHQVADQGGLDAVSLRSVAARLGVTPMALYRHVAGKDDLLAELVDARLGSQGLPPVAPGDWQSWLAAVARSLRRLLGAEPAALGLFSRRPVTTWAARNRLDVTVDWLIDAGFTRQAAVEAYAAVHTYTLGFCALEAARSASLAGPVRAGSRGPARSIEPEPVEPVAEAISRFVSDEQFELGLGAMVTGLAEIGPS